MPVPLGETVPTVAVKVSEEMVAVNEAVKEAVGEPERDCDELRLREEALNVAFEGVHVQVAPGVFEGVAEEVEEGEGVQVQLQVHERVRVREGGEAEWVLPVGEAEGVHVRVGGERLPVLLGEAGVWVGVAV